MEGLRGVPHMKAKLEVIFNDNDEVTVDIINPGDIDLYTLIGILEKVKTELIISSPAPTEVKDETI